MFKARRSRIKKDKKGKMIPGASPDQQGGSESSVSGPASSVSNSIANGLRKSVIRSSQGSDRSSGGSQQSPSVRSGGSYSQFTISVGSEGTRGGGGGGGVEHSPNSPGSNSQSKTSRQTTRTNKVGVRFAHVRVQEYERVISDNPSCSSGAPIGLGWAHAKERRMYLDEYESSRPERKNQLDLVLTRQDREELLLEWGATFQQIIEAIRANIKIKNQRRRTVNNLGTYDRWEEAMESASRKIKRTVLMQKPIRKRVEEMQAKAVSPIVANNAPVPVRRNSGSACSRQSRSVHSVESASEHTNNTFADVQLSSDNVRDVILSSENDIPDFIPVMEIDVLDQENAGSYSHQGSYPILPPSPPSSEGDSNDDFESLRRDDSFWEMQQGADAPQIRRKITPVIISEDPEHYDGLNGYAFDRDPLDFSLHQPQPPPPYPTRDLHAGGFSMQPPPYSNSIISQWE